MTVADLENSGVHIIDSEILVSSDFTIGQGSRLLFKGGKIKNYTNPQTPITIYGDDITIEAGPVQIFEGLFIFKAESTYQVPGSNPIRYEHYVAAWTMDRAYPQWFGAKDYSKDVNEAKEALERGNITDGKAILDSIPDASAAINAAIQLKQRGEVFIPRGYYRISSHINVLPGIQLRGENGATSTSSVSGTVLFPWVLINAVQDYASLIHNTSGIGVASRNITVDFQFPLPADNVDWLNINDYPKYQLFGYMIAIGIQPNITLKYKNIGTFDNPIYSEYPVSITYKNATGNNVVGTEIASIALIDVMSLGNGIAGQTDHATMRGILAGGAVRLRDVRVYGLSQLVSAPTFGDQMVLEHCSFNDPVMLRGDGEAGNRAALYPTKIYGFDVTNGGDAFVMHGCHVSTYNDRIGALKLRSCNGGSVTGNILNSDILIERCQGIDFAGNHMEYGSRLTIASSGVAVRGNFIWRGDKAAITIRRFDSGGYLYYHCSVTLDNNQFFWRTQHYDSKHPDVDPPQAAHFLYPYDVVTDGYASIAINNTFRQCRRNLYDESSYFGILMGWLEMRGYSNGGNDLDEEQAYTYEGDDPRNIVGTDYARISDFEEFNRVSHIASNGSKVEGRNVSIMPTTLVKSAFVTDRNGASGITPTFTLEKKAQSRAADGWKAEGVRFEYRMWQLADFDRRLVMCGPIETPNKYKSGGNEVGKAMPSSDENICIRLGHGTYTNFDIPAGPYLLYVERIAYNANDEQIGLMSVTLPVCAAAMLWDDGEYLSGFAWTETTQSLASRWASSYNAKAIQATFNGRNVDCLLSEMPSLAPGSVPIPEINGTGWVTGDILRVGDSSNPMTQWLKTDYGWHKM